MIRRRLVLAVGLALALLGTGSALPGAAQASGHKTYTLDVTPCVNDGNAAIVVATLSNTAVDQRLGSANLTLPGNLTPTKSLDPKATLKNQVLEVRGIDIKPNQSYDVEVLVDPGAKGSTGSWAASGKQSNDYKGTGNDFTLDEANSQLETIVAAECGFEEPTSCTEDNPDCSVTLRHYVPCSYVLTLNPAAGCGGANLAGVSAFSDATGDSLDVNYYVETTVMGTPKATLSDAGDLQLWYEKEQDKDDGIKDDDAENAGCAGYTEPSDLAARFLGPDNRDLHVTYSVSAALWSASGNLTTKPPSCFSAPYFYGQAEATEPPFEFEGKLWFNSKLSGCTAPAPVSACQKSATITTGGSAVTEDLVPWSPFELLDPMRY